MIGMPKLSAWRPLYGLPLLHRYPKTPNANNEEIDPFLRL